MKWSVRAFAETSYHGPLQLFFVRHLRGDHIVCCRPDSGHSHATIGVTLISLFTLATKV